MENLEPRGEGKPQSDLSSRSAEDLNPSKEHKVEMFLEFLTLRDLDQWHELVLSGLGASCCQRYSEILAYVDAMTLNVKVPNQIFTRLREHLPKGPEGDRQLVEITTTCAAYNCVSRFLVAMNVGDMNR